MKALIDTNVLLDAILHRHPFASDAQKILMLCNFNLEGYIAVHSFTNIFYVLHDTMKLPLDVCRNAIRNLCTVCSVPACSKTEIETAVNDIGFRDFEDSLQNVCATSVSADYIITRNKKDFADSTIKVVTPSEFIALVKTLSLQIPVS